MAKVKTMFVCQTCGATSPKWLGKCPECGEWNTYVEETRKEEPTRKVGIGNFSVPKRIDDIVSGVVIGRNHVGHHHAAARKQHRSPAVQPRFPSGAQCRGRLPSSS